MYKLEECYWDTAMFSDLFYCLTCQFGSVFDWREINERCVPLVIIVSDLPGIVMCQTKQSLMLTNIFQDLKCLCNLRCSFEFVRSEINTFTLTGARSWSIVHYVHWIWRSNIYMWNPTIYNTLWWSPSWLGQMACRPSVWCSKHYFLYISYKLRALKTLYSYFCKFMKKMKK